MAILFISGSFDPKPMVTELLKFDPKLDIRIWPNTGNPADIDFALVWYYPHGELLKYPNLKCISSMGAGADHILKDPNLPKNIPVMRLVDKLLIRDMSQFIILQVLNYTRLQDIYQQQQLQKNWLRHPPNNEITIGIMGLGQLGKDLAKKLVHLGFTVIGWSRTQKKIAQVKTFAGKKQFKKFLSQTQVLVNLLPLTPETENILNIETFQQLPKGAYLINVARGKHVVDEDLLSALDKEQLSGAVLDVFRIEPLPQEHPFWQHPKIKITPHMASVTNPKSVARQIVENYHRMHARKPLLNKIKKQRGY